jgi:Tfp pilus assembly protein PilX
MNTKYKHMRKSPIATNQQGLVSFVVTIIIMLILSLIVMGFARLSRREQRQALDRQLSTQAFYAAEAGINDAVDALKKNVLSSTIEKDNCDPIPGYNNVLNTTGPISYSCVLVDPTPPEYNFDAVDQSDSEVVMIQSSTGANIDTINFYWQDKDGKTGLACPNVSAVNSLPTTWPAGCDTGMLRIDLVPYGTASSQSRLSLVSNLMTAFLYPSTSGPYTDLTYINSPGVNQGVMARATCNIGNTPKYCRLSIVGLSSNRFYLRMKGIYGTSSVTITSQSGGSVVEMSGYQALVDSTGKANDVLRRVRVAVPINSISGPFPEFAAQSEDSLCKRFTVSDTIGLTLAPAAPGNACDPRQN